jgi:hypothetical protein
LKWIPVDWRSLVPPTSTPQGLLRERKPLAGYIAGAATFEDTTHEAIISPGEILGIKLVNNATAASAPVGFVTIGVYIQ